MMFKKLTVLIPLSMGIVLYIAGCTPEPNPIRYGSDTCAHCIMVISDIRYGAEIVLTTGKTLKYDAIECMASAIQHEEIPLTKVHSLWVTDFERPETLLPVDEAIFLQSPALRSPMGMNLTAFTVGVDRDRIEESYPGRFLSWPAVVQLIAENNRPDRVHAHDESLAPGLASQNH